MTTDRIITRTYPLDLDAPDPVLAALEDFRRHLDLELDGWPPPGAVAHNVIAYLEDVDGHPAASAATQVRFEATWMVR